jgi:hypothetical protein
MARMGRIVGVTLGLAATGAVAGAGLGGLVMATTVLVAWHFPESLNLVVPGFLSGAVAGAKVGAVLAPAAAWALLRWVPLGRAIGETAIGAFLGAIAGVVLFPPLGGLYGALAGFCAAAVRLRLTTRVRDPMLLDV